MPLVAGADRPEVEGPLINRAVARSLARRRASYADEVERIVAATYEVIERTGSLDPTMRDILRQSGISTQAFYRHFRSKDELLLALLDDGRRQLTSYLAHRMAKADTVEGALAQMGVPPGRLRLDAEATYHVAIGTMHQHIRDRTRPSAGEIEHV